MRFFASFLPRALIGTACLAFASTGLAQRVMENLGRGVVATKAADTTIFVSWRLLGTEPATTTFNLYRATAGGTPTKLNAQPLNGGTSFADTTADMTKENLYTVRAIVNGSEAAPSAPFLGKVAANAPVRNYFELPLSLPPGTNPNDASVGDLDGDGEYELVLKGEQRPRDTASTGLTGETVLQGYKIDGTLLWTINLGKNVREGAHDTQFMVADLDGDGRAEVACRTADGTIDGKGKVIGDANADWRDQTQGGRTFGRILKGPEYFTIFDGRTGAELASAGYLPERGDLAGWGGVGGNGGSDNVGNRANRFLAAVAYLDGKLPSVIMCRGYYGRSVLAAWDWRGGKLTSRWVFDSENGQNPASGQGGHQLSVADVDGDGRDEIVYHSLIIDDNGKVLINTKLRHGDALHVSDLDPSNPGLEVWGIHENEGDTKRFQTPGVALYSARDGKILWGKGAGEDAGRGMTADIDPRHPGAEMWASIEGEEGRQLWTAKGELIGDKKPRSCNFAIWWDGDLLRELLDRNVISKWDWEAGADKVIFTAEGATSNNGSKSNPALSADLFGDWREEVIFRTNDNKSLRIYTTTIPTEHRITTLMHDPQYRAAIAWQNVGYNQPPHPSFFIGQGMTFPTARTAIAVPTRP